MSFTLAPGKPLNQAVESTMSVPAFSDIAKASNDLLNKDFYHTAAATLEVKTKAPNGVSFTVKGKSTHDANTGGSIEAKYADPPTGRYKFALRAPIPLPKDSGGLSLILSMLPETGTMYTLMQYRTAGLTITQAWTTLNALDTKVELDNSIAKGLKAEILTHFIPSSKQKGAKANLYFKQPNLHARAFFDLLRGPTASLDAVVGNQGFLAGAEAGYDVQKAAITRYSLALGYSQSVYSAVVTATNNLSVFSASYYQQVNSQVEAGAKATWDSKQGNNVGLEVASKYLIDPVSFAKAKINDRGIAALAYNIKLKPGVTFGVGASFDTQKLNEAGHKVGASFTFEG